MGTNSTSFLKWYLLALKIKAQVDKDRERSTEEPGVGERNHSDRVGQGKKQLVVLSSVASRGLAVKTTSGAAGTWISFHQTSNYAVFNFLS